MQREPVETITLVIRAKDGQTLEKIKQHCQAGAYVAIGRGTAVIHSVQVGDEEPRFRNVLAYCPDWLRPEAWKSFCVLRQRLGRELSHEAARYNIRRLEAFREEGFCPEDVVRGTVAAGWMNFHITGVTKRAEASV